jgi:GAF domain-containing protein
MRSLTENARSPPTGPSEPSRDALIAALADRERELAEATRQQTATADILKVISRSAFDLQTVFDSLLSSAATLCGAIAGNLWLRDGDVLRHKASFGLNPDFHRFLAQYPQRPTRELMAGRVFLSGKVEAIPDALDDKEYAAPAHGLTEARSILGAPLLRGERVEGAIVLLKREPGPFPSRQIELVQTFADQAVIAIENVRLLDEVQTKTRDLEEALEQQTATANVLKVISRSAFDLDAVLKTLTESAQSLSGAATATVLLRDGEVLRLRAESGCAPEFREYIVAHPPRLGRETGTGRVLMTGETVHIPDVLADPDYNYGVGPRLGEYRAQLGVPLICDGKVEGVFGLMRPDPGAFTSRQIEMMRTFADQAVIAIENVRLFDEVQAKTRDLEEALEQQTATANVLKVISRSAFDLDAVLKTLADSARSLAGAATVFVFLRDGEVSRLRAESGSNAEHLEFVAAHPIRPGRETAVGRVLMTGESVHIPDVLADPEYSYGVAPQLGKIRALFSVPLIRNGGVGGVFALMRPEPGAFTPRQIEMVRTFADQAVIAVENARLFNEVQARTRELSESLKQQTATAEILRVISNSLADTQPVFEAIVQSGSRLFAGAAVTVALRDHDKCKVVAVAEADPARAAEWRARFPTPLTLDYLHSAAILDGRVVDIADADNAPAEYALGVSNMLKSSYRALTVVPMKRGADTIGALSVSRVVAGPLTEKQLATLKTFADQAVIAVQNTRLLNELRESLTQQTATADVLKVISRSAFDLPTVLQTLVESAARLCEADKAVIVRQMGGALYRAESFGFSREFVEAVKDEPVEPTLSSAAGRALLAGRNVHIPDIEADPDYTFVAKRLGGFRAILAVPMLREREATGVLALVRSEPRPFTDRQIETASTFADQAAIAIENVRLFDEVQAKTRDLEEALQQQTATANVLKVISRSAFDLDAVLKTLTASARSLSGAASADVMMRDGDVLMLRAESGCKPDFVQYMKAHPSRPGRETLSGRVLMTGEAVHIPDILADPEYHYGIGPRLGNYRAMFGAPLIRNGKVDGVFTLMRPEPGSFTPRQIEMVRVFADQAVIAIENARLFSEVQTRTQELVASLDDLRRAQDRLIQSEKLASLGQLTAGIAHEIKNPLNFVNNFSVLSRELLLELRELLAKASLDAATREGADELIAMAGANLEKVLQHGKRADSIVKNMLLHAREGTGERASVKVNSMVEEALNLAYHGARAEKPGFNVNIVKSLDPEAGAAELFPQEITRVLLNLISNGFYATTKRKQVDGDPNYEPSLSASTRNLGDHVEIAIRDNGTGISHEARGKIFNPFFTTKPAGEGTGLGLSLSHDIVVKQHGGTIVVETEPNRYTQFTIRLPRAGDGGPVKLG